MSKIDEMLKNEKVEWKTIGSLIEKHVEKQRDNPDIKLVYTVSKDFGLISSNEFWKNDNDRQDDYTVYSEDIANYNVIRKNMFAYNPSRLNIGSIDCLLDREEGVLSPMYVIFKVNESIISPLYFKYYIQSPKILKKIDNKKEHGARFRFDFERWNLIKIPVPSLEVQEKFIKTLDLITKHIDKLKYELDLRNKQYEYYRDKLLSEEHLNKLIKKYDLYKYELKETTLGDLAQVNRGASPRPISNFITNSEDGVPWIKISDAGLNSKYINQTIQRITREGAKKSRLLKKGDFIISNSMSYGRPYILAIEGCIHDGWASISEYEENLNSDFLYHYLNSNKVQNYWLKKMNTSSVSNLNSDIIKSLPIPLIDKNLQAKIAEILDKFQALTQDISGSLPDEIEKREKQYEYYREKLLTFDTERTRGGYQVLSNDYIGLLTQTGALVGVNVFELEKKKLEDLVDYEQPNKYIVNSTDYSDEHETPVLTAGQTFILGYTNEKHNIYEASTEKPVIIFDDFTSGNHWVDFNFKVKSSAMKMLKAKENINLRYVYYYMQNIHLDIVEHKRLWISKYSKIKILIPPLPIQEYIVSILDKFEALSQSTTDGLRREIELREKQYEYYREKLLTFEK